MVWVCTSVMVLRPIRLGSVMLRMIAGSIKPSVFKSLNSVMSLSTGSDSTACACAEATFRAGKDVWKGLLKIGDGVSRGCHLSNCGAHWEDNERGTDVRKTWANPKRRVAPNMMEKDDGNNGNWPRAKKTERAEKRKIKTGSPDLIVISRVPGEAIVFPVTRSRGFAFSISFHYTLRQTLDPLLRSPP